MLTSVITAISEQVLSSRPALERPITHLKYSLAGSVIASIGVSLAIIAASAAFYLWLTSSGLEPEAALIVVSGFLLMSSVLAWRLCSALMQHELDAQERELQAKGAHSGDLALPDVAMQVAAQLMEAFIEGAKTPPSDDSAQTTPTSCKAAGPSQATDNSPPMH